MKTSTAVGSISRWGIALALLTAVGASVPIGCSSNSADDCTSGTACALDEDCPSGTRCSNDVCTKIYCLADGAHCDVDEVCKSKACIITNDPYVSVCWPPSKAVPEGYECGNPIVCETGLLCNLGNIRCVRPGSVVQDGKCSDSAQCAIPFICNCSEGGICTTPSGYSDICCGDTDCQAPYSCKTDPSHPNSMNRYCL